MEFEEAKDAYTALSRMLTEFEKNLEENEHVGVSGIGPSAREFIVSTILRYRNLIQIVGTDRDDDFCQIIFSPDQIALNVFVIRHEGPRQRVGFHQE